MTFSKGLSGWDPMGLGKGILINYNTQLQKYVKKNCLITDNCQQEQKKKTLPKPCSGYTRYT